MSVPVTGGEKIMQNHVEKVFARRLKEATRDQHGELDKSSFGQKLANNTVSKEEYTKYLVSLLAIYEPLEIELKGEKTLTALNIPGLFRAEALKNDLKFFNGEKVDSPKAAEEYRTHLEEIGRSAPHCLIAHAYVRYMGDLFGGQLFGRQFVERWEEGTSFYQFDQLCEDYELKSPQKFVNKFRKILNGIELTQKQEEEVCEETRWAFQQHIQIFKDL